MRKVLPALCCFTVGLALLLYPEQVTAGVAEGLRISVDILLPSLFPFMALSSFVALSGLGSLVALPLRPLTRLLGLPDELGAVALAGLLGGFATGARTLSSLVAQGRLSDRDAARMLHFLINPGPAFVLIAVGDRMLGSRQAGLTLFAAQMLSSLTLAFVLLRRGERVQLRDVPPMGYAEALVEAVQGACAAMLSIASFVLLFSAVSSLITPHLASEAGILLTGLLEVTAGCSRAATLGGYRALTLCAFFLGFSGLSVICQARAVSSGAFVPRRLIAGRLAAGLLSALWCALLSRVFEPSLAASVSADPRLVPAALSADRMLGALCLMGMAVMTLERPALRGKKL